MGRKHHHSVVISEVEQFGPILIRTTENSIEVKRLADLQESFGGEMHARLERQRTNRAAGLRVVLRYSIYSVPVGQIDPEIVKQLRIPRGKVARCTADIDTNPDSPNYLDIWLNPQKAPTNPAHHSRAQPSGS